VGDPGGDVDLTLYGAAIGRPGKLGTFKEPKVVAVSSDG
jgi:hypothetical protein